MKLKLHTYASDEIILILEAENQAEKEIINFFFEKGTQPIKGGVYPPGDIHIKTDKKFK